MADQNLHGLQCLIIEILIYWVSLTLSAPNLKVSVGTTLTFNNLKPFRSQRLLTKNHINLKTRLRRRILKAASELGTALFSVLHICNWGGERIKENKSCQKTTKLAGWKLF